ncbi:AraC family transcriptional regulator [Paenibacillus sp. J2TS4]|uniref:AraC family transcriptional regulator n=1 Tax=Paenibacillus sp. J2TS4 TaxID=2807194 RepID=UPI001B2591DA|nr:AraC family transcriptional regulator [Paenibacillus sp. J2TS4]GIP35018.1 AraC family transcriptional regulator [Paenibacillus sp. J2TS4]
MYHYGKMLILDSKKTTFGTFRETFHAHKEMEFVYVHEGTGQLITDGKTFAIRPGVLLFFQPFQLHRVQIEVTEAAPFIRSLLIFDPQLLEPYMEPYPALKSFYQHLYHHELSMKLIEGIAEEDLLVSQLAYYSSAIQSAPPDEKAELIIHCTVSFLRMLKPIWQERGEREARRVSRYPNRQPHQAETMMQWLDEHYKEEFQLEKMAKALHLSPYHLSRRFKEMTGSTLSDYLQAARVRQACLLLTKTPLSIQEIGIRVGLTNPSYFCQLFKKKMGISPHQFRLIQQRARSGL